MILKILYVTCMSTTKANGVNIAVTQLLNSLCNYAEIYLLNLNDNEIEVNPKVNKRTISNYLEELPDIAVFEDPFNTLKYCKVANELRKRSIPYIITPHGCFHKVALRRHALKKTIAINTLFRKYLHSCYAVQYLCSNEEENSIRFSKSIIIPNGISDSNEVRIRKAIKDVVFISRKAVNHKGLDLLLESIKAIKYQLTEKNIHIHIYGSVESQEDETFLDETIGRYKLSEIVENKGPVFGKEKETVLSKADLFILTSRHEGFPMSILEAFTYGLPVLITTGTNMGELVSSRKAGWVCDVSVDAISKTLLKAINTDNCTLFSENARKIGMEYSWDKISTKTIETYQGILDRAKG